MKYSVTSNRILYRQKMIAGYICIKNQHIKYVIELTETDRLAKKLPKYLLRHNFNDKVIMPAAIDTNISLNCGLEGWDYTREFTRHLLPIFITFSLAILGGVSLIVNSPFLSNPING